MATAPEATVDLFAAVESLRAALDGVGIVLPRLAVDATSPSLAPVDLGRVRADVAVRHALAVQREVSAA